MEITLTHHSVIVKDVQLGENFSKTCGDVIIDNKGRVKFIIINNHFFYMDLHQVPSRILRDISDYLNARAHTRILKETKYKIDRVVS